MGKANRNRNNNGDSGAGRRRQRATQSIRGMAPDVPMPTKHAHLPDGHPEQRWYWKRVLEQYLHEVQFLFNYISYVADGGFNVPNEHLAPQRTDETTEQYQQRRDAVRQIKETQAKFGNWAELAVQETRYIRPSDAGAVATWMIERGSIWCTASGYDPTANDYRAGATPLLHALCPPEHLSRALEVLDMFWREIVEHRDSSLEETVTRYPIATLHVCAAMTAWLFSEPACVPDQAAAQAELLVINQQLVDRLAPAGSR